MKYDAIFKGMIVCVRHKNIQLSTTYMRTVGSVRCMDLSKKCVGCFKQIARNRRIYLATHAIFATRGQN